jgi:probable HAF family extracellular repeat protein
LGTLGGTASVAHDINNAGKVVGDSYISTSSNVQHAVLWEKGKIIDLGTLDGNEYSQALAINNAGKVVGKSYPSPPPFGWVISGNSYAVLWDNNSIKDLNNLIPPKSGWILQYARSINDKGQIVGMDISMVKLMPSS